MNAEEAAKFIGIQEGWIICTAQECQIPNEKATWCTHIQQTIEAGLESDLINPMRTYNVPIFPSAGKYAIVRLGEPISEFKIEMAEMKMLYTPDIGRGFELQLGLWVRGDGLLAIRGVVIDYIRANIDPTDADNMSNRPGPIRTPCPNSAHSFASNAKLRSNSLDTALRLSIWWDIVFENACTFCREEAGNVTNSNFGLAGL